MGQDYGNRIPYLSRRRQSPGCACPRLGRWERRDPGPGIQPRGPPGLYIIRGLCSAEVHKSFELRVDWSGWEYGRVQ